MLPETRLVLERDLGGVALTAYVEVIRRHGSRADAEALCPLVLADPGRTSRLLPVLAEHGDTAMAEQLASVAADHDDVLHVVGYLGHEPAQELLWQQAKGYSPGACLGLLHLPCDDLADEIHAEIDRHHGEALFPEFLPALAIKTGDPALLPRLVDWGRAASTDCNGGLVLGISLFGDRAAFTDVLWDPWWEVDSSGTGTIRYAYAGTRIAGLTITELYDLAREQYTEHALTVFVALLEMWTARPWLGIRAALPPTEDIHEVHRTLFEWSTPHRDDALTGYASDLLEPADEIHTRIHHLSDRIADRLAHQTEVSFLARQQT